jgi:hypothetical protein
MVHPRLATGRLAISNSEFVDHQITRSPDHARSPDFPLRFFSAFSAPAAVKSLPVFLIRVHPRKPAVSFPRFSSSSVDQDFPIT